MPTPMNQSTGVTALPPALRDGVFGIYGAVFTQDALAASQSAVQLLVAEVASAANNAVDGLVMPFSGRVVAVTAALSAAATAGALSIAPTVGGVAVGPALGVSTELNAVARGVGGRFAAGDRVGAEITTSAAWNGTTADLAVTVWVAFDIAS